MSKTAQPVDRPFPTTPQEVRKFLELAERGDKSTLPGIRRILQDPDQVERLGGNLATQTELSFIRAIAGDNLAVGEAINRKLELMRAELTGQNPTPVERLLVERVVGCWLQVQNAEIRYAQGQNELSIRQADYHQRRMDHAHRRHLSAIKALALVRKLAVPVLQVNIAREQVNVASGTGAV